jgi:DNA replication protein DnaD
MRRERRQNEQGKFEWGTIVYEEPYTEKPSMENPSMEKPSMENPQLLNNKELNNNLLNNKEINDDDIGKPNPFVEFERAFGYLPPSTLRDEFNYWIDESQFIEPEAIICEVIKRAKLQMPRNPSSYVSKILKDLHHLELFTLDAVREYNEKFDQKTKRRVGKAKVSEIDWEAL